MNKSWIVMPQCLQLYMLYYHNVNGSGMNKKESQCK